MRARAHVLLQPARLLARANLLEQVAATAIANICLPASGNVTPTRTSCDIRYRGTARTRSVISMATDPEPVVEIPPAGAANSSL